MPSNTERHKMGNKDADQADDKTTITKKTAADRQREKVADTLDEAAETVKTRKDALPKPLGSHADEVEERLGRAASYVREHDASVMTSDAWKIARDYPVPAALIVSGLIIGGSVLAVHLLRQEGRSSDDSTGVRSLYTAASNRLGPQTSQTMTRLRDAMLGMALMKFVETIDGRFPGFREHFDKA
jgi:hypothetical protein